jgi:ssDNA-binding Zn-finger/Zn-ribbon topoisomerase 1
VLGWCTINRVWQDGQSDGYFEINICAEFLNRFFEEICSTLLHEMCHLLNVENNVNDTSRSGTYHNKSFKRTAETHGLLVEKGPRYGYHMTCLAPETKDFINTLEHTAFELYRQKPMPKGDQSTGDEGIAEGIKNSSTRNYKCPKCGTKIRATKEVRVRCEECNVLFEQELESRRIKKGTE